jgi:hypothetical protein
MHRVWFVKGNILHPNGAELSIIPLPQISYFLAWKISSFWNIIRGTAKSYYGQETQVNIEYNPPKKADIYNDTLVFILATNFDISCRLFLFKIYYKFVVV